MNVGDIYYRTYYFDWHDTSKTSEVEITKIDNQFVNFRFLDDGIESYYTIDVFNVVFKKTKKEALQLAAEELREEIEKMKLNLLEIEKEIAKGGNDA